MKRRVFPMLIGMALMSFIGIASAFTLTSSSLKSDGGIPLAQQFHGFGCAGGNQSPPLSWSAVPAGTKSFALTVYDPDAPSGSGWWHWVVVDIPGDVRALPTNAGAQAGSQLPKGALQIRNDFGAKAYGGPCPPNGSAPHHYIFTIYALKVPKLELSSDATAAMAGFLIHANAIGQATIEEPFGRE